MIYLSIYTTLYIKVFILGVQVYHCFNFTTLIIPFCISLKLVLVNLLKLN